MTYGEEWIDPDTEMVIVKSWSYKQDAFRVVACPDGQCVFIPPCDMPQAFLDLNTWSLFISPLMLDQ